jgi:hypothetical protein
VDVQALLLEQARKPRKSDADKRSLVAKTKKPYRNRVISPNES